MNKAFRLLLSSMSAIITITLCSCNDIIDRKLSDVSLQVYYPVDSFLSFNYSILFQWEAITGAQGYRIQIAQPNFIAPQKLVLDTLVKGNKYTIPLLPGTYIWRMRAENGSSYTSFVTRTLFIDSSSNLNGQMFYTSNPSDKYITNKESVVFTWPAFPYANKYEYVLTDTSDGIVRNIYTYGTSISDFITEGIYLWKVRALDTVNLTSTMYSAPRKLIVDTTVPIVSQPFLPANNTSDTNFVTIRWVKQAIDAEADSVFLANDTFFTNTVYKNRIQGASSYTFPFLTQNQNYFWRLRTSDAAGNWSGYSVTFRLRVN